MNGKAILLVTALFTAAAPARANAEEAQPAGPRSARLLLPLCPTDGLDAAALIEILAVELQGQGVELGGDAGPAARLIVDQPRCQAGDPLILRLEAPDGAAIERSYPLPPGAGRERVLALALAELLRREWPMLVAPLAAEATPPSPRSPEPTVEPDGLSPQERAAVLELLAAHAPAPQPAPARPRLLVDLSLDGRIVPGFETGLAGLTAGVSVGLGAAPLRLELDAGAWYGLASDPLGKVDLLATTGAVALLFGSRREPWRAALGPRVELGWVGVRGRPYDETAVRAGSGGALFAAVSLEATVRIRLVDDARRGVWLLADGQVGFVVAGVEASASTPTAAAVEGLIVDLSLGISFEARR